MSGGHRSRRRRQHNWLVLVTVLICPACVVLGPTGGDAEPQPGEVEFELAGPGGAALVVPVKINDAGPFRFVLDTGATMTCVEEALVKELSLPDAPGMVGIGGGLRSFGRMRLVSLDSVALGDASVRGLQGCAIDLGSIQQAGIDVRGLLGLNFLKAYRVILDFPRRTVRVERSADRPADESRE
jgi:hypothetical protein